MSNRRSTNSDRLHFRGDSSQFESRWAVDEVEAMTELARQKKRRKRHPMKKDKPVTLATMPWEDGSGSKGRADD